MSKRNIFIVAIMACMSLCNYATAQDFDLATQRKEIQEFKSVDGKKIDHKGLVINPTPHELTLSPTGAKLDISGGVQINDKKKAFADDVNFLTTSKKGVKVTIDYGKAATKAGAKATSGAYVLTIDKKGVSITGYDEVGAYYGLQTLRQIVASDVAIGGKLPYMTIKDYPDLPLRGLVEGFYGTPWSHQVRLSLIEFLGNNKMNTYVYGPKDDPYHSSPNWRLPYPADEVAQLKELVEASKRNRVNFVWAIHPGQDIKWTEEDYQNLLNKFNLMYDMGVRHFSVFFDDISGDGTSPSKQTELLNRITEEFVKAKGDVGSLIFCPTDYNKSWANPTPRGSLAYFGNNMNPEINIFWTGDVVCSDVTKSTLDWVGSRIKRPALFWWNYPVTDYVRNIVLQGPVYGLQTSLTPEDLSGILSNPMEHGEASKLALYGVGDYTWNIADYNPIDNWERALVEMAPIASEAYRTFAIHSSDTETGYRRDEGWETTTFGIDDYTAAKAKALRAELDRVIKAPQQMEAGCTDAQLLTELRPWLAEFGKLGTRCKVTIDLIEMFRDGDDEAAFWSKYVSNLMTPEDRKSYEAHKSGTMKLQPFYENAMNDMSFRFLEKLTGEVPCAYRGMSSYPNSRTILPGLMLDGDTITHYTSALPQRKDSWMGVDLRAVRDVREINILQGRNSVDDVDFFDHCKLECSVDGQNWTTLIDDMQNQYVINWTGEPVKARYVRIKRLESKRTNYVAVREFRVNPAKPFEGLEATCKLEDVMLAFDSNAASSFVLDGSIQFNVDGAKGYTLLMGQVKKPVTISLMDANGTILREIKSIDPFTKVVLPEGIAKVKIAGTVEVFEIIPAK